MTSHYKSSPYIRPFLPHLINTPLLYRISNLDTFKHWFPPKGLNRGVVEISLSKRQVTGSNPRQDHASFEFSFLYAFFMMNFFSGGGGILGYPGDRFVQISPANSNLHTNGLMYLQILKYFQKLFRELSFFTRNGPCILMWFVFYFSNCSREGFGTHILMHSCHQSWLAQ